MFSGELRIYRKEEPTRYPSGTMKDPKGTIRDLSGTIDL